jgi:hypothetical protein
MPVRAGVVLATATGVGLFVSAACSNNYSISTPSHAQVAKDPCSMATPAEIATASGMTINFSTDNKQTGRRMPGCTYSDAERPENIHSLVVVSLVGDQGDALIARTEANPQEIVQDVPNLGERAIYVTTARQPDGDLFVKVDQAHAFDIKLTSETTNPEPREIAVAKLLLPRLQGG